MEPKKVAVVEHYINKGEEMTDAAITSVLLDNNVLIGVAAMEEAIALEELVVVIDNEDREKEGDFIMVADLATPETIATLIRYSSR
eukprot:11322724-Ditylum_brightwellii.AAC.1